jgi:hypothetical protein
MNLHRIDFISLSLFNLVARTGSISQGAELAMLAVGAASKRITDLESAFGVVLLERHSRGVHLTPAGQALFGHVQRLLSNIDQMSADLSDHAKGLIGVVRLWANTSALTQFLPNDLAQFSKKQPSIRIELTEAESTEVVLAILDGRADMGLFADRTQDMGLNTTFYKKDHLVLVVPEKHPLAKKKKIAFSEAIDYEFVSLTQTTSLAKRLETESAVISKPLRIRIHVRSFDAMCQMVAAGLGIAVLPLLAAQPLVQSMGLKKIELTDSWVERELLLGVRDLGALTRPVRSLFDHLVRTP